MATFELATGRDDAELRRLLRDSPMGGAVRLSTTREPSFFRAAEVEGPEHQTIVGRGADGGICALGTRSVRLRYVNGRPARVGYLGSLRLNGHARGNGRLVIGGYRKLRELHEADGRTPIYLTSIMSGNAPALRLLESGARGLPVYQFLCEFLTLVMRVRRAGDVNKPSLGARGRLRRSNLRLLHAGDDDLPAICATLDTHARPLQFAPAWEPERFMNDRPCPRATDFRLAAGPDRAAPAAVAALWDLRDIRQHVVHGYDTRLTRWRRTLNGLAWLTGRPGLPPPGDALQIGYVSHLAHAPGAQDVAVALVEALHAAAATRGLDYLVTGFAAADPRLALFRRRFGGRTLCSRLYIVYWPDDPAGVEAARALDGRLPYPEVALL